jgi:hypothetical protein
MKVKWSKKFQLDTETLKRLLRTALIMFTPVILIFLDQIQNGTMDWRIIWATAMWIWADAVRRFLTDYSK